MPKKAFFIGPCEEGWTTAVKPWMISDSAFAELNNAYVWRGRVKKRVGSKLFESTTFADGLLQLGSRLRTNLGAVVGTGITDGTGAAAGNVPGAVFKVGQMFSIGTALYTVCQTGTPATMLITDGTTTATFNTTTGAYVFVGAPVDTQIYFYPSEPVMGIINYEQVTVNNEPTFAFDTQFAYQRTGNAWDRLGLAAWTGSNAQFFWSANYRGTASDDYVLFVVNNNRADQIKYWLGGAWTNMYPDTRAYAPGGNYTLQSARLLVAFKDRLIALNTIEEVGVAGVYHNFAQRARWCQNGSPFGAGAPACTDAWYDNVPGKGGWIEAPTKQAIISARILKDRLIVYFERSTWELVYTGNQVLPFVWQTIDDQLGAESTFSSVLFDKVVFGVGETGIHACDGLHVERIDNAIPQLAFQIHNDNSGVDRVAGIRDYATEMVYWSYPDNLSEPTYPNKILSYNYKNSTWANWDDSVTAWGYYQNVSDLTWGAAATLWGTTSRFWAAGSMQGLFRNVLAGNQEGYTFIMDSNLGYNASSLQVTNIDITGWPILTVDIVDHNLQLGDYVKIEHTQGVTNLDNRIFKVTRVVTSAQVELSPYDTDHQPVGTYTGGAVLSRVSRLDVKTKEYNFYPEAYNMAVHKISFDVDKTGDTTGGGKVFIGIYTSTSAEDKASDAVAGGIAVGTYVLDTYPYTTVYPSEVDRSRLVHPVYVQAEGDCIQLQLGMREEDMFNVTVQNSPFELNSMTFYATPTATRY